VFEKVWEEAKELGYTTAVVEGGCPGYHAIWYAFLVLCKLQSII
jgi:hypothetical protein